MPQRKWNLGDIRPPDRGLSDREVRVRSRRPMQDVIAPASRTTGDTSDAFEEEDIDSSEPPRTFRIRGNASSGGKRKILFLGGVVLVFVLVGFLATLFLQGAELTVHPKFKNVTVQATFTAYQDPKTDMLGYELLTLEETGERAVTATRSQDVKEQATGEIIVSNAFTKDPQRLIKNTRFESADGKIFRISDSVVVPGYTTNAAGEKVPGTVTAKVFADVTGEAYNIPAGRFTIPGFKGSPQFDTISGESKSPMQGGFVGKKLIVDDATLTSTKDTIHAELKDKLLARLHKERPASFVLYEDAARIRFESLPSVDAGQNQATIREHAVLEAPLFAEADFARYLAQNTIVGYGKENVRIDNAQALKFSYVTVSSTASSTEALKGATKIDFTLAGNAKVVWKYDMEKLRHDVAGIAKSDVPSVLLKNYPSVERATAVMRPFWKQSFPKDPAKIKIVEILDLQGK